MEAHALPVVVHLRLKRLEKKKGSCNVFRDVCVLMNKVNSLRHIFLQLILIIKVLLYFLFSNSLCLENILHSRNYFLGKTFL